MTNDELDKAYGEKLWHLANNLVHMLGDSSPKMAAEALAIAICYVVVYAAGHDNNLRHDLIEEWFTTVRNAINDPAIIKWLSEQETSLQ